MFRFYKQYVQRMLMGLVAIKLLETTQDRRQLATFLAGQHFTDPQDEGHWREALGSYQDLPAPGDDILTNDDIIHTVLSQFKKDPNDTELIDTVVKTLQLPFAGNRFGMSTLRALRDAILRPDELAEFRKQTHNITCSYCSKEFRNHEYVSTEIDNQGLIKLVCFTCMPSSYVPCFRCGELTGLKNIKPSLGYAYCGCKSATATAPSVGTPFHANPPATTRVNRRTRTLSTVGFSGVEALAPDQAVSMSSGSTITWATTAADGS